MDTLRRCGLTRVRSNPVKVMNFVSGLTRINLVDLETARLKAKEAGFETFVLPANGIVDRASFFSAVRATFPLDPPLVGSSSWDALADSLFEGLQTLPSPGVAVLWPNPRALEIAAPLEFRTALNVLADLASVLADRQATCDAPKVVAILLAQ